MNLWDARLCPPHRGVIGTDIHFIWMYYVKFYKKKSEHAILVKNYAVSLNKNNCWNNGCINCVIKVSMQILQWSGNKQSCC